MKYFAVSLLAFAPLFVFAQKSRGDAAGIGDSLGRLIDEAINFINAYLIPLVFAVAFLVFIWGVYQYFIQKGGDDDRQKGKEYMLWGIVAFFIMVSVWGLVNLLDRTFQLDDNAPELPYVPTSAGADDPGTRGGGDKTPEED